MKKLAAVLALFLLAPLAVRAQQDSLNGWRISRIAGSASGSMRQVVDTATEGIYSQSFTASVSNSEIVEFEKDFGRDIATPWGFQIDGYMRSLIPFDPFHTVGIQIFLVSGEAAYQIRGFTTVWPLINWYDGGFFCRVRWYAGIGDPPKSFRKMRIQFRLADTTLGSTTVDEILDNLRAVYAKLDSAGYYVSTDSTVVLDRFGDPDPVTPPTPQPVLSVLEKAIDFGNVPTIASKDTVITLRNMGNDTLQGIISIVGKGFSVEDTALLIPPMDSLAKTVRFSPALVGKLTGLMIIHSNDPTSPDTVLLSGFGDKTDGVNDIPVSPKTFSLSQNYPNPFNPSTVIEFSLAKRSYVNLAIYNMLGQKVGTLADGEMESGIHRVTWNAVNMPSGMYFCRIETSTGFKTVKKMTLVK